MKGSLREGIRTSNYKNLRKYAYLRVRHLNNGAMLTLYPNIPIGKTLK